MLSGIRERAGRWVVGGIMVLLVIPFALWGIGSYFQPSGNAAVARVGDVEIGTGELQRAVQQQTERYRELLGERFRPGVLDSATLRRQALEQLIRERLVQEDAQRRGLRTSDAALAALIQGNPAFAGENGFDPARYRALLRERGLSPAGFETQMRDALLTEQLERGLADSAFVSETELDALADLWFETRDLVVATLPREAYAPATPPDEPAIQAYYDAHAKEFQTPEQVRVAYVLLERAALLREATADEAAVRAWYDEHRQTYTRAERRHVRHILISVDRNAPQTEVEAALERTAGLKEELDAGADFGALARQHSQDPGSAGAGGDLGSYTRGALDPDFDAAAFSLEPGRVSAPVRSAFGWHLIRVDRVQPARVQPLDSVRAEIIAAVRARQAEEWLHQRVEELRRLAFEQPESLAPAAAATGLAVQESGFFTRAGGTGVAQSADFVRAAFSDEVLVQRLNSDVIELGDGRYAALRLLEHQEARPIPLAEVRSDIAGRLEREAAAAAATKAGEEILARLAAGSAREALELSPPLAWQTLSGVSREGRAGLDPQVVERAFALARPRDDKVHYAGVALDSGDYVLVGVTGARADARARDAQQRRALRESLVRMRREAALAGYLAALRQDIEVRIYPQRAE